VEFPTGRSRMERIGVDIIKAAQDFYLRRKSGTALVHETHDLH